MPSSLPLLLASFVSLWVGKTPRPILHLNPKREKRIPLPGFPSNLWKIVFAKRSINAWETPALVFYPRERESHPFAASHRVYFAPDKANEDRCVNPVDSNQQSYLFTLRVWPESVSEGQIEWRGKVCFVVNQEEHYFRDWPTLVAILEKMLPLPKPASSS
jgi:hypothetical protein